MTDWPMELPLKDDYIPTVKEMVKAVENIEEDKPIGVVGKTGMVVLSVMMGFAALGGAWALKEATEMRAVRKYLESNKNPDKQR